MGTWRLVLLLMIGHLYVNALNVDATEVAQKERNAKIRLEGESQGQPLTLSVVEHSDKGSVVVLQPTIRRARSTTQDNHPDTISSRTASGRTTLQTQKQQAAADGEEISTSSTGPSQPIESKRTFTTASQTTQAAEGEVNFTTAVQTSQATNGTQTSPATDGDVAFTTPLQSQVKGNGEPFTTAAVTSQAAGREDILTTFAQVSNAEEDGVIFTTAAQKSHGVEAVPTKDGHGHSKESSGGGHGSSAKTSGGHGGSEMTSGSHGGAVKASGGNGGLGKMAGGLGGAAKATVGHGGSSGGGHGGDHGGLNNPLDGDFLSEDEELHAGHALSDQHILYNDLFKAYNKEIRPIISHDDIMTIHFEIALFNILSLDSKTGVMVTNTEVIMIWHDPYLMWDPEFYNHTTIMRVPYHNVWHPDIILYNTADKDYEASLIYTNVIINFDGTVKLLVHGVFSSVCDIDIQWFPFDQQTCDLMFAPWTSDVNQILLERGPSDITRFHPNHEFFLENFWAETREEGNPCCTEMFSMVVYHVQMQRRVKFAMFFFIIPGVLINICALLVFSLPAETGEKVGLGINSMLAMMVFLMAMTENLPPTETLPLAGVYYGVCLIVLTFNIGFSVYVLNLAYSGDRGHDIPQWVKSLAVMTAKIVLMKIPEFIMKRWKLVERDMLRSDRVTPFGMDGEFGEMHHNMIKVKQKEKMESSSVFKDEFQRRSIEALENISYHMEGQTLHYDESQKKAAIMEEWKFLSRVLDRVLFILFGITTFLFNVIILTQSPFGEKFEYCPLGPGLCADGYSFSKPVPGGGH